MEPLHINTPLIESLPLSERVSGTVWLKMEPLQPSGSFKLRGVGHVCQKLFAAGTKQFISSSGGNAGIAVAYCGRQLGVPVTVVVPESTTAMAIATIRREGATVIVKGESWQEAHAHALELTGPENAHIHPFDDPELWTGHATLIDEVVRAGRVPDAVVLSVGGGGLLNGVLEGLARNNLPSVPVLAVETAGADALSASLKAGRHVELDAITSIATSLGAKRVAPTAFDRCRTHPVTSHVIMDTAAVDACLQFAADHRVVVEPACGASLATVYNPVDFLSDKKNILVVVCGGAGVTIDQLHVWQQTLAN